METSSRTSWTYPGTRCAKSATAYRYDHTLCRKTTSVSLQVCNTLHVSVFCVYAGLRAACRWINSAYIQVCDGLELNDFCVHALLYLRIRFKFKFIILSSLSLLSFLTIIMVSYNYLGLWDFRVSCPLYFFPCSVFFFRPFPLFCLFLRFVSSSVLSHPSVSCLISLLNGYFLQYLQKFRETNIPRSPKVSRDKPRWPGCFARQRSPGGPEVSRDE